MADPPVNPATTVAIGQVEPFQMGVDDWDQYTEHLTQYFEANSIETAAKQRAVFLTVVGAKTYALLSNLLAPEKPSTKTYDELVAAVKAYVDPKLLIIAERFRFHQRNQGDSESVAQYMAELRKLADRCEFGAHLHEALRDQLVCGLKREAIQRKLLTVEDLTLQKVYQTAHSMEMAEKRAGELQSSAKGTAIPNVQYTWALQGKSHLVAPPP